MKVFTVLTIAIIGVIAADDLLRSVNHGDIITKINEMKTTWKAGKNERFEGMTVKEARLLLGALETPENSEFLLKKPESLQALPDEFDLRIQYPQCESLREIRDQSNCGSCWAFGAASAMSDRICIASGGKLQTRVSTENILACCNYCGYGCNGGYPMYAWNFWQYYGVPTGGLYQDTNTCQPYSFAPCDHHVVGKYGPCGGDGYSTPKCKNTCQASYPTSLNDDKTFASDSYQVFYTEDSLKTEIYQKGSIECAFSVYEDFLNYKSGVYQHVTGKSLGGHAIKVIGWGVENGVKYWLVVNSWNEGWGDNGTFKILRGSNHVGIERQCVAGTPLIKKQNFLE
jgi:cathepsin B